MSAVHAVMICAVLGNFGLQAQQTDPAPAALPGLLSMGTLDPPLISDITHLKFSPDGEYIVAQDDSSVFVLSRPTLMLKFRIDAPLAGPAQFAPDSSSVVFTTSGSHLSVERWDVADGKRVSAREVVLVGGCVQSLLSPDGNTLACFSERVDSKTPESLSALDLELIDVPTGNIIATKKNFVPPKYENVPLLSLAQVAARMGVSPMVSAIPAAFSPDSRYFAAGFEKSATAVDLISHAAVAVHGDLEWMLGVGFVFIAPNRVLVPNRRFPTKSEILDFPSGAVVDTLTLGDQQIETATRGDYVFLRPIKSAPVGVFNWRTHRMIAALRDPAGIDIYDRYAATQMPNGRIALYDFPTMKAEAELELPADPLVHMQAEGAAVSPDLSWLALSNHTRGGIWNLSEMRRHYSLRGFTGAYFDNDEAVYVDAPRLGEIPRSLVRADLSAESVTTVRQIDEQPAEIMQYGRYILAKIRMPGQAWGFSLEVRDARDGHTLWIMNFPKITPGNIEISPDDNRVVLRWLAEQKPAMDEIKKDNALEARYKRAPEHISCFLLQILNASTGKSEGNVLVEARGWARPPSAFASGDWLFVGDNNNRTQIYSVSADDITATVPGPAVSASASAGLLAVELQGGDLQLYSLPKAELRPRLSFPSAISIVRFSSDGKRVFVLTTDQKFYIFDTKALSNPITRQIVPR